MNGLSGCANHNPKLLLSCLLYTSLHNLTPEESLKYEIADELGLLDKVLENGWKQLSAKETGRIGGLVTKRTFPFSPLYCQCFII